MPIGRLRNFDTIEGFESGTDLIQLVLAPGDSFVFLGNVNSFAGVDSSLSDVDDNIVQAVYDQVANILYVDLNSDGDIDSEDLQIVINPIGGGGLTEDDFDPEVHGVNPGDALPIVGAAVMDGAGPEAFAGFADSENGPFTASELTVGIFTAMP